MSHKSPSLENAIPYSQIYFRESAGKINVGATLRFLLFGSSSEDDGSTTACSGTSISRFRGIIPVAEFGVSGGVPSGAADPVDDIDKFRAP